MKLLLYSNLPPQSAQRLQDVFPLSKHVRGVSLQKSSDTAIWNYAKQNGFTIVSKKSDFYDRSRLFGFSPKVIWLKIGNCSITHFKQVLRNHYVHILAFERDVTTSYFILA